MAKKRGGISPWVPNQHGAWAMLVAPAILGVFAGVAGWDKSQGASACVVMFGVLIAWFFGYCAFFAFGLAAKARNPKRRAKYAKPVYVYGAISAIGIVVALVGQMELLWWALGFVPLVGIAVVETLRGRARSTLSGIATTIASALLVPVLVMVASGGVTQDAWIAALFLALYFSGTIPFVKSMIRERGSDTYFKFSVAFHVAVLVFFVVVGAYWYPGLWGYVLAILTLVIALVRAVAIPLSGRRGKKWTAKAVGIAEVPHLLLACVASLLITV